MRSFVLIILIYIVSVPSIAQKHDNIWLGGIANATLPHWKGAKIEFGLDSITFDSFICPIYMVRGQITMSDAQGNLLFYTNGNYIVNRFHEFMPNGMRLNKGSHFDDRSAGGYVNYFPYGYMVIPDKEDSDIYYLIHPQTKYHKHYQYYSTSEYLKCTRINMRLDGGKGDVDEREKIIYPVKSSDRYRIIQHGNGRDYWFLTKDNNGQYLHVLLFSRGEVIQSEKIRLYGSVDYLHTSIDSNITNQELLAVSNNGEFILDYKGSNIRVIYDFNRCTGEVMYRKEFNTPIDTYQLPPPNDDIIRNYGRVFTGFSPDDRFYYCSSFGGFYQYDLEANDISSSVVQLSGPAIVLNDYQVPNLIKDVVIPFSQIGPDGKIYALYRRNHYVIHNPDKKGVACDFEGPKAFDRNVYFDAPLYPNYRMGPLKGSSCDTLISSNQDQYNKSSLKVYPNPTSGPITIELDLPDWSLNNVAVSIYDAMGRQVHQHQFPKWAYKHEVDPGVLPAGVYILRLEISGAVVYTDKLVVN